MAGKVMNNSQLLDEKANQLFDAFSILAKQHGAKINMHATELDALKRGIQQQASRYANTNFGKTKNVLQAIYTTQKQALTIQQGIEQFYKKGLEYYYEIRAIFTTERITDTVYIQLRDNGATRWVRAKDIPFSTLMAAANPSFILIKEQKEQEADFYHLKAQLNVSYNNLLQELEKLGYDYQGQEDVTSEMETGLTLQESYNNSKKVQSRSDSINIGNVAEAVEKVKQDRRNKVTYSNVQKVKQNWLSGLLGGDVGEVQVKALSVGKSFQIITLNNITSKFKKLAKTLNSIQQSGKMSVTRIKQFISLFYVDFFNKVDDEIDKKIMDDIDNIIKQSKKK